MTGRKAALDDLSGPGVDVLRSRPWSASRRATGEARSRTTRRNDPVVQRTGGRKSPHRRPPRWRARPAGVAH